MLLHKSLEFDSRVRREASALAQAGHDVVVLELSPVPPGDECLDGVRRRSVLPSPWVTRGLPFHLHRAAAVFQFIQATLRLRPDVIHAHDAAMLLPGLVGARLTGAHLLYDSHELATSVPYRERTWAWSVSAVERMVVTALRQPSSRFRRGSPARLQQRYQLAR